MTTKIPNSIFKKHQVIFAYQFGSTITGHSNKKSDVDIAIYLPENMNKIDMFDHQLKLITELENFYKKRVDLVILNKTLSLFFKYIILKEGKLIYNANIGKHADYFCKIFNLYFDYKPFQDQFNKHYVQRNI